MKVERRYLTGRMGHRDYQAWVCGLSGEFHFQVMWSEEVSMRKVAFEQDPEEW